MVTPTTAPVQITDRSTTSQGPPSTSAATGV